MFLLTVKKKFIKELTVIGIVLTTLVAVVYHLFIPDRYFLWFPAIPIFFYLFGLFYIEMFAFNYRVGLERIAMTYLVCKLRKKANDEKNTVHNHHAVTADGGSGCADEGTGR